MKIMTVNSSPRAGSGSATEFILNQLVLGMKAAGAEVRSINLREKTIRPCQGCLTCWTKTPGSCILTDDMRELLRMLTTSHLVVYATPLYFNTMNATMSTFRERLLPLSLPFTEKRDGKRAFLQRYKMPPVVWLSVCALSEQSEFDALSNYVRSTHHPDTPILAEIYRTSSETLRHPVFKETVSDILEATKLAGGELVRSMKISPDTMARIKQPLTDPKILSILGNLTFKACITEKVTLKQFFEKGMTPRPDSLDAFMAYAMLRFNAKAAGERKVVLQFRFSGELKESCYFTFDRGMIEATVGTSQPFDIAIDTPFELWMDIMTGKTDGREMFMTKKYQVQGDLSLMQALFRGKEN